MSRQVRRRSFNGGISCLWVGMAVAQALVKCLFEDFIFVKKKPGKSREQFHIPTFTSKTQIIHNTQFVKKRYGAAGKVFGTAKCIVGRQFQYQICTVHEGNPGTEIFIHHGRCAALYKIAAHNDNTIVCPSELFCLPDMIGVSVVKRIIFRNNTYSFHDDRILSP